MSRPDPNVNDPNFRSFVQNQHRLIDSATREMMRVIASHGLRGLDSLGIVAAAVCTVIEVASSIARGARLKHAIAPSPSDIELLTTCREALLDVLDVAKAACVEDLDRAIAQIREDVPTPTPAPAPAPVHDQVRGAEDRGKGPVPSAEEIRAMVYGRAKGAGSD